MRANSVLAKLAKTKNECSIWLVYTIAISIISAYHEPWFDEYHVWFMCEKMKLTWLWSAMTREGHFMLWHLLIYPFVKLGCSFWCLQFVGVCLASIAAFILTFKAPFNLFTKVLILFSYPILFQFFVIARCYALIPAILFVIAWLHKAQNKHKFLYCFFIGLLAHTHAYMEGMVGGLFLLYCWDHIYKPYKKNINIKSSIYGALITIGVVFMAFIQVSGSLKFAQENITNKTNSILEVIESICLFRTTNYNFIIPGNWHQLFPDIIQYHSFPIIFYFMEGKRKQEIHVFIFNSYCMADLYGNCGIWFWSSAYFLTFSDTYIHPMDKLEKRSALPYYSHNSMFIFNDGRLQSNPKRYQGIFFK